MKTLRLLVLLFIGFAGFPSFLYSQPPDLTEVRFLPGDDQIGPAAGDQETPVITRGDNTFLLVWVDTRTDMIPNLIADEGAKDIYAVRIDVAGNPLDATPLTLNQEGGDQSKPSVSWNGQNWLIVWLNQEATQYYYTDQIVAARVSPEGMLLDPQPIPIVTFANSGNGELYDVACDGTNWAVAWKDYINNQWRIQATRISPQGIVLDQTPVTLHTTPNHPYQGAMHFAQDEYFLAWKEWRHPTNDDILARRFTPALQQMETNALVVTAHGDYDTFPDVVTNGTDFFVVWERYNTCCVGGGGKVYGARINHSGTVLDPAGIAISGYVGETIGRAPTAAWDGTNYFVGWVVSYDLFAARVSSAGSVLDPGGFVVGNTSMLMYEPDLAGSPGGGARMVWKDNRAGGILANDIYQASISAGGIPGNASAISLGAPTQLEADVQAHDSGYMIAYRSEISGVRRIMAQPLDDAGNPVTPAPVLLAAGARLEHPSLAWNGSLFLVTWASSDVSIIYGRRIGADGTLIDAAPFTIMAGITPDVAALGDTFLVVGTHNPVYFEFRHPFSVRVRGSDRTILDATPRQLGQYYAQNPSVSTLGGRWIATWQRNMSHDDADANINATFIALNGVPTSEFIVSGTYFWELYTPAVASSGSNALIVWRDSRNGFSNIDVYGRIVLPDGSMQAEVAVSSELYDQFRPEVTWTGTEYVALYQDRRNIPYFFDTRSDIYATRLNSTGQVIDPDGFPVANGPVPEILPAAAGRDGVALFVTSLFEGHNPLAAYRAGYRFMGMGTGGGQPPVVSDIPNQSIPAGGRFVPIRADNQVSDPDDPDSDISWTWSGNSGLRVMWDAVRRRITVRPLRGFTGSETITFTATDPGGLSDSDPATFTVTSPVLEGTTAGGEVPSETQLEGNYPNPFNPSTTIRYALSGRMHVSLKVYSVIGEEVATLVDEVKEHGYHEVMFDARNLGSGTYFYRLVAGDVVAVQRLVVMK